MTRRKEVCVSVMLSPEEKLRVESAAQLAFLSTSAYCRRAILSFLRDTLRDTLRVKEQEL